MEYITNTAGAVDSNSIDSTAQDKSINLSNLTKVLAGDHSATALAALSFIPKPRMLVFVSSTFTDTYEERNVLMQKIQPKLQVNTNSSSCQHVNTHFDFLRLGIWSPP